METYPVRRGDCMATIAEQHGYAWKTLWEHAANKDLRTRRKNPNALLPVEGYAPPVLADAITADENKALDLTVDYVAIPDKEEKQSPAATDATHTYEIPRNRVRLSLQLLENGDPIAGKRYELTLSGMPLADAEETARAYAPIHATTDADGMIDQPIPIEAVTAELLLPETGRRYHLILGGVHPYDTLSGAQARLQNLGFFLDNVDGELRDTMRDALRAFQKHKKLPATGNVDAATLRALRDAHDGKG